MAPGSRLQELTAKYMQNPRRYFVPLANEYRKAKDLDRAIALCREHLPAQPGHMSGHIVLGQAYFEKGDLAAAREVFMVSVGLDDENLIALRHLGDIARKQGDVAGARQWYARVLDADPQNAEIESLQRTMQTPLATPVVTPRPLREVNTPPLNRAVAEMPAPLPSIEPVPAADATQLTDFAAALLEPTPPGLRAITDPQPVSPRSPDLDRGTVEPQPAVTSTLQTFDFSTLSDDDIAAPAPVAEPLAEIVVDDGVGFAYADLDQMAAPAAQADRDSVADLDRLDATDFAPTLDIPADRIEPLDFAPTIDLPAAPIVTPAAAPTSHADDDVLSRPGFGALASFASWRSAKERATPGYVPPIPASPEPPVEVAAATGDLPLTNDEPAAGTPALAIEATPTYDASDTLDDAAQPESTTATDSVMEVVADDAFMVDLSMVDTTVSTESVSSGLDVAVFSPLSSPSIPARPADVHYDLDFDEVRLDTAPTAPEFVTETMAALYAQQGFSQQALDVYRELLRRNPDDSALAAKALEMESALARHTHDSLLEEDADKALSFNSFEAAADPDASMLEAMYDVSPPGTPADDFTATWTPESDKAGSVLDDDWFAEPADDSDLNAATGGAIFGVALENFDDVRAGPVETSSRSGDGGAAVSLATVFGAPAVATSDQLAADMLISLADHMVGRLPKEAPTLPVPDVLELPNSGGGDGAAGKSAAPLLSFDRFFSGSGAPPRSRGDTPSSAPAGWNDTAVPTPPSLSPTFGGVPVIPPPPANVTPATWAAFDQFVTPSSSAAEPAAAATPLPTPISTPIPAPRQTPAVGRDVMPAADPSADTWTRTPTRATPTPPPAPKTPVWSQPAPAPTPVKQAPVSEFQIEPDAPVEPPAPAPPEPPAARPPSDFHRWLEGLS
jgi:Tetratricopeptide repeat